jgi:hypothetical protein
VRAGKNECGATGFGKQKPAFVATQQKKCRPQGTAAGGFDPYLKASLIQRCFPAPEIEAKRFHPNVGVLRFAF